MCRYVCVCVSLWHLWPFHLDQTEQFSVHGHGEVNLISQSSAGYDWLLLQWAWSTYVCMCIFVFLCTSVDACVCIFLSWAYMLSFYWSVLLHGHLFSFSEGHFSFPWSTFYLRFSLCIHVRDQPYHYIPPVHLNHYDILLHCWQHIIMFHALCTQVLCNTVCSLKTHSKTKGYTQRIAYAQEPVLHFISSHSFTFGICVHFSIWGNLRLLWLSAFRMRSILPCGMERSNTLIWLWIPWRKSILYQVGVNTFAPTGSISHWNRRHKSLHGNTHWSCLCNLCSQTRQQAQPMLPVFCFFWLCFFFFTGNAGG